MKFKNTFYALFVVILTMPLANAQTYQSLSALKGATWNYYQIDMFLGTYTGHTTLDKDTIINGKTYLKLSHKSQWSYYTYIHEDLDSLKFTFINQHDTLVLDLSIAIGVEKNYYTCPSGGPVLKYRIDSISTLYDANNVARQAHYLSISHGSSGYMHSVWIEGLGSFPYGGIFMTLPYSCYSHFDYPTMLCVKDSLDNLVYRNPFESSCTKINVEEFEKSVISVFPNPANSHINISWEGPHPPKSLHYTLTDNTGRTVRSGEMDVTGNRISLTGLAPGLYFLTAKDKSGETQFKEKIVLQP